MLKENKIASGHGKASNTGSQNSLRGFSAGADADANSKSNSTSQVYKIVAPTLTFEVAETFAEIEEMMESQVRFLQPVPPRKTGGEQIAKPDTSGLERMTPFQDSKAHNRGGRKRMPKKR